MRIAYVDCVSGASGDMLLSALVDAGASAEIARSVPAALHLPDCSVDFEVEQELVTPTGAVLLTSIAHEFGGCPAMTLGRVGLGAGWRELPFPNVVRVWLGEAPARNDGLVIEMLTLLETNIDDLNPQIYEHVLNRLLAAGALDVTLTPMQMKKNRPATQLAVLCRPGEADTLLPIILTETTTLGVRRSSIERVSLPRSIETVETRYGSIRVKVARWNDLARAMPEYEDCRRAAEAAGAALIDVLQAAREVWYTSAHG